MEKNKTWLAAHLYYEEPLDIFLTKAVFPYIQKVIQERNPDQFFFIRYFEKGPHIRMRFKLNSDVCDEVKNDINNFFYNYFSRNPSNRKIKNEDAIALDWFPNDSVQFIDYEPETERYGGEEGIVIAENQFQQSTEAVMAAMIENESWSYTNALGVAIAMHIAFVKASGYDLNQAKKFFSFVSSAWLPRAVYYYYGINHEDISQDNVKEILEIFEQRFNQQKEQLVSFHEFYWPLFDDEEDIEQEWLKKWYRDIKFTFTKLIGSKLTQPIEYILESYVHMTNNRLGLHNIDESYLAFLIQRSLQEINI